MKLNLAPPFLDAVVRHYKNDHLYVVDHCCRVRESEDTRDGVEVLSSKITWTGNRAREVGDLIVVYADAYTGQRFARPVAEWFEVISREMSYEERMSLRNTPTQVRRFADIGGREADEARLNLQRLRAFG